MGNASSHGIVPVSSAVALLISNAIATQSEQLPAPIRAIFLSRAGIDVNTIHIHVGAEAADAARALSTRAFSIAKHIVFGRDELCLTTRVGLWLLAHEIAHAVQQQNTDSAQYWLSTQKTIWEVCANAFATYVLDSPCQSTLPLTDVPPPPAGLVLRHDGPKCPGPPNWLPISAAREEVYLTANNAIELAYKLSHRDHAVVFGGDFETARTITLPKGTNLSKAEREFGDNLLLELKGISWQLRPDIIDFTERKFYEIKTVDFAENNPAKAVDQLANYYRIAEAIRVKYGGPEWSPFAPDWYPPHLLPFDSDMDRVVCTAATAYVPDKEHLNTVHRPGLILYKVLEKVGSKTRRQQRAKAMRISELAPELRSVAQFWQSQIIANLSEADDREYLLVCTRDFVDSVIVPLGRSNIARIMSLLQVFALDIYRNPVVMMRLLGWSIVGISELLYFTVPAQIVLVTEEGAVAAVAAEEAVAAATIEPILIKVPEAIVAGMKAANDTVVLKTVAGILFVIGTAKSANAESTMISMDQIGVVRAIPLQSTWELGTLSTGVEIPWAGKRYFYLGRAISAM